MQSQLRANIELGAQIAIAIAVVVIAGVVVKRNLFPAPASPASLPRIAGGERLNIPNVSWEQNKKRLVFFLMKDCVHCQASAPFYKQLIEEASKRDVKLLTILYSAVHIYSSSQLESTSYEQTADYLLLSPYKMVDLVPKTRYIYYCLWRRACRFAHQSPAAARTLFSLT